MPPITQSTGSKPGRPPVRQREVASWLRRQVVEGELNPGDRIPSRRQLCQRFGASLTTIQAALELLSKEGFIESRSTSGTFVHQAPPHLSQYILLFPVGRREVQHNRFWSALEREAIALPDDGDIRLDCAYVPASPESNETLSALEAAVAQHRVSGIIFPSQPWQLRQSPLLTQPGISRSYIAEDTTTPDLDMAMVIHSSRLWRRRALDRVQALGCRRVAWLTLPDMPPAWMRDWLDEIGARDLSWHPSWHLVAPAPYPQCALNAIRLLLTLPPEQRPDALVINDDNLVEAAIQGALSAGVDIPADLKIIAHCNFPNAATSAFPIQRLGYSIPDTLRVCLQACRHQEETGALPAPQRIEPVFEDELAQAPKAARSPITT